LSLQIWPERGQDWEEVGEKKKDMAGIEGHTEETRYADSGNRTAWDLEHKRSGGRLAESGVGRLVDQRWTRTQHGACRAGVGAVPAVCPWMATRSRATNKVTVSLSHDYIFTPASF